MINATDTIRMAYKPTPLAPDTMNPCPPAEPCPNAKKTTKAPASKSKPKPAGAKPEVTVCHVKVTDNTKVTNNATANATANTVNQANATRNETNIGSVNNTYNTYNNTLTGSGSGNGGGDVYIENTATFFEKQLQNNEGFKAFMQQEVVPDGAVSGKTTTRFNEYAGDDGLLDKNEANEAARDYNAFSVKQNEQGKKSPYDFAWPAVTMVREKSDGSVVVPNERAIPAADYKALTWKSYNVLGDNQVTAADINNI